MLHLSGHECGCHDDKSLASFSMRCLMVSLSCGCRKPDIAVPYLYVDLGVAVLCASFMSFGVKRRWFALGCAMQLAVSTYAGHIGGHVHYGDWLKVRACRVCRAARCHSICTWITTVTSIRTRRQLSLGRCNDKSHHASGSARLGAPLGTCCSAKAGVTSGRRQKWGKHDQHNEFCIC